MEAAKLLAF